MHRFGLRVLVNYISTFETSLSAAFRLYTHAFLCLQDNSNTYEFHISIVIFLSLGARTNECVKDEINCL